MVRLLSALRSALGWAITALFIAAGIYLMVDLWLLEAGSGVLRF